MTHSVQEPASLLTAPGVAKREGQLFLVLKVLKVMRVIGSLGQEEVSIVDDEIGLHGCCPIFTDYEKALAWADGDPNNVKPVSIV